jgi:Eukaryotic aspartyl protease
MDTGDEVEVCLENFYNYNYVGRIMVGSPPQAFNTIFDTGSTNFWVLSNFCEGPRLHNGCNHAYDPDSSPSYAPTNLACQVEFGSGSVQGFFARDEVTLGVSRMDEEGRMHEQVVVKDQVFGVMTKECVLDESFDCICGLAYPTMANTVDIDAKPLFDNMISQRLLKENIFAFYMSLCHEESSELVFGWADETKYQGPIVWHPVIHKYFWSLRLVQWEVNEHMQAQKMYCDTGLWHINPHHA